MPYVNYVENPYSFKRSFSFHITVNKFIYGTGFSKNLNLAVFNFTKERKPISVAVESVSMQEFAILDSRYVVSEPDIQKFNFEIYGISLGYLNLHSTLKCITL